MVKYRIRYKFKSRIGNLYFNLEKSENDFRSCQVIAENEPVEECERVLKAILEGEREVIIVPIQVSTFRLH
jgi:hypothetical protein